MLLADEYMGLVLSTRCFIQLSRPYCTEKKTKKERERDARIV